MNLARAFLTTGARSVVASLAGCGRRPLHCDAFMESFYEHLKAGSTVNAALRQAQSDFIKNYGDNKPNLWAGFEVIGDGTKRFTFEKSDTRSTILGFSTRRRRRSPSNTSIRGSMEQTGPGWPRESRERIISRDDPEQFEQSMHDLVRKLGTSHTGFFHQSVRRVPGRLSIGASFRRAETEAGPR